MSIIHDEPKKKELRIQHFRGGYFAVSPAFLHSNELSGHFHFAATVVAAAAEVAASADKN